jgi:hypothetical protein
MTIRTRSGLVLQRSSSPGYSNNALMSQITTQIPVPCVLDSSEDELQGVHYVEDKIDHLDTHSKHLDSTNELAY